MKPSPPRPVSQKTSFRAGTLVVMLLLGLTLFFALLAGAVALRVAWERSADEHWTPPATAEAAPAAQGTLSVAAAKAAPQSVETVARIEPGRVALWATEAQLHGPGIRFTGKRERDRVIGDWRDVGSFPQWSLELLEGEYHVDVTYAAQENDGGEYELTVADKVLTGHAVRTPKKNTYLTVRLGTIHLPAGATSLTIKPALIPRRSLMSLLRVDLLPVGSPGSGVAIAMADALAGAAAAGSDERDKGDKNDHKGREKKRREREREQRRKAQERKRPAGAVTGLLLVDVERNAAAGSLSDGMVVNLADFDGKQFTVQARVKGEVQSVRFEFTADDGREKKAQIVTENDSPYALAGDREGAMLPLQTPTGSYRLSVIPFAEPDGKGHRGQARNVRFRIEDRSSLDTIVLSAAEAELTGDELRLEDDDEPPHIGAWRKVQDEAVWAVEAPAAGLYRVEIDYASDRGGGEFEMRLNAHRFTGTIHSTGGADQYRPFSVGEVALPAGRTTLRIKPTRLEGGQPLMNLREVRIVPVGR